MMMSAPIFFATSTGKLFEKPAVYPYARFVRNRGEDCRQRHSRPESFAKRTVFEDVLFPRVQVCPDTAEGIAKSSKLFRSE